VFLHHSLPSHLRSFLVQEALYQSCPLVGLTRGFGWVANSGGSINFEEGGGGRQFISYVLIYRKCAQRSICLLHGKSGFLTLTKI